MNFSWGSLLEGTLALLSIINPLTVVPAYVNLTRGMDSRDRDRLLNTSVLVGFGVLALLTFLGRWIIERNFQIQVAEFRMAGGLLLTVVAVRQIVAPASPDSRSSGDEVGIVPLAIPFLIGPGTIVTSMLVFARDGWMVASLALGLNFLLAWVVIRYSSQLYGLLGKKGSQAVERIFWIFLTALGVHVLVGGINEVFGLHLALSSAQP